MANPTSGIDALLQALKTSGMDMGGMGGSSSASDDSSQTPSQPFIFDFSSISDVISSWGTKKLLFIAVVFVIVLLALYWWFHPPINIHSFDTWVFVTIFILLPVFLVFQAKSRTFASGTHKVTKNTGKARLFKGISFVPVAIVVLGLVGLICSFSFFPGNAQRYASILTPEQLDFATDIYEANYSEIPIIDHDSAELLGNKEMGTIPEYVSQFEVDSLYSQINYHGAPVRVSPLNYADLFKWLTNRASGIPAYALVDMTTQDAQIITLPDGEGITYCASEPLGRNIDRYIQLSYPFYMFDEKSFEVDEDGHPWWVCPVQTRTIGLFGGTDILRVVLCDAVTGECQDVAVEDCPEWVDRVYPAELLITQYNWYGSLENGWLNSWLGQKGVVQTTPGSGGNVGYNYLAKDDDVWVYTGVTSATSDESIVGFVLINQRTHESHYYAVAGATEISAMGSAEGQVQNLRYVATFPLLINIGGQPTYFMALKDSEGLVKKFAMIDIQRYQNVAVGDTLQATQSTYIELLATNGVELSGSSDSLALSVASGMITSMTQAVIDGNSHFYVVLDSDPSMIFDFPLPSLMPIVAFQVGDAISFTYTQSEGIYTVQEIIDDASPRISAPESADDS